MRDRVPDEHDSFGHESPPTGERPPCRPPRVLSAIPRSAALRATTKTSAVSWGDGFYAVTVQRRLGRGNRKPRGALRVRRALGGGLVGVGWLFTSRVAYWYCAWRSMKQPSVSVAGVRGPPTARAGLNTAIALPP